MHFSLIAPSEMHFLIIYKVISRLSQLTGLRRICTFPVLCSRLCGQFNCADRSFFFSSCRSINSPPALLNNTYQSSPGQFLFFYLINEPFWPKIPKILTHFGPIWNFNPKYQNFDKFDLKETKFWLILTQKNKILTFFGLI